MLAEHSVASMAAMLAARSAATTVALSAEKTVAWSAGSMGDRMVETMDVKTVASSVAR
jgi:hypothetical protein